MQNNVNRIDYLDSVRGIAAMMVVVYHFIGWKWGEKVYYNLGSLVFNGSDAVSLFFVLSGFVLSFKYLHTAEEINIEKYVYNRVLRIYPAFVFTVLLNFLYWNRHNLDVNLLADIFYANSQSLWQELVLVRHAHKFYIPGWTLGIEMALSLLMPLLVAGARKDIKYVAWLIPISIFIGGGFISMFVFHFCLGVILAYFYNQIREFNFREHKLYPFRFLLLFAVFLLFSIRHLERIWPFGETYHKYAKLYNVDFFHITGFASFLILAWIINSKSAQKVLAIKPLVFLGKISYSVYLMHWLIVVIVMEKWDWINDIFKNRTITFSVMLPVTIIATLISATIVYNLIEKRFIKLSRKVNKTPQKVLV
ncbi:acyltransferase family protein [Adhaeribacter soli]|uniref:Acyltransferase n=1 Tax=Adhaeribacter soli TaxID=2607655 RepID=A0A5N1IVB9_9BACT|nr:acyltransferase [Adhaeribacter soli]KAA9333717.1 acyltransferase [Adhaeribacter soli]